MDQNTTNNPNVNNVNPVNNLSAGGAAKGCFGMGKMGCALIAIVAALAMWAYSGYNGLVTQEEEVKTAWSQVENQYQRRIDLIKNVAASAKKYAKHENETFQGVTNARARTNVGSKPISRCKLLPPLPTRWQALRWIPTTLSRCRPMQLLKTRCWSRRVWLST